MEANVKDWWTNCVTLFLLTRSGERSTDIKTGRGGATEVMPMKRSWTDAFYVVRAQVHAFCSLTTALHERPLGASVLPQNEDDMVRSISKK